MVYYGLLFILMTYTNQILRCTPHFVNFRMCSQIYPYLSYNVCSEACSPTAHGGWPATYHWRISKTWVLTSSLNGRKSWYYWGCGTPWRLSMKTHILTQLLHIFFCSDHILAHFYPVEYISHLSVCPVCWINFSANPTWRQRPQKLCVR